mmetsp:Transcript_7816/g.16226  ORF Transcript_7816/g.16226 Transcript_7816/m.16226 type:complete len:317 (+) Transcript_7816:1542-2492(+)
MVLTSCVMIEKLCSVIEAVAHSSIDRNEALPLLLLFEFTLDIAVPLLLVLLEISSSFNSMDGLSKLSGVAVWFFVGTTSLFPLLDVGDARDALDFAPEDVKDILVPLLGVGDARDSLSFAAEGNAPAVIAPLSTSSLKPFVEANPSATNPLMMSSKDCSSVTILFPSDAVFEPSVTGDFFPSVLASGDTLLFEFSLSALLSRGFMMLESNFFVLEPALGVGAMCSSGFEMEPLEATTSVDVSSIVISVVFVEGSDSTSLCSTFSMGDASGLILDGKLLESSATTWGLFFLDLFFLAEVKCSRGGGDFLPGGEDIVA